MNDKKQLLVNMSAAIAAFVVQAGISFVLTPFITSTLGAEAYGFVTLSNTLFSYASIITVAITSMASRFIALALFKEDDGLASKYYSSTIAAILLCVVLVAVPALFCIWALDSLLNVSAGLVGDVRVLMLFALANFSISLISSNLSIGFYVRNRLYLGSAFNAVGSVLRAALMVVLFAALPVHIWVVGLSTFLSTTFVQFMYLRWKRKLIPDLKFTSRDVSLRHALEIIKSGIWNSVTQLGTVLSNGLDVLVCNLFLGGGPMGVMAISKVVPQAVDSIGSAVTTSFQPTLTRLYAEGKIDELIAYVKWSMKTFGLIIALPVGAYLALGQEFFKLWVPGQDSFQLYVLSAMAIGAWAVMGPTVIVQSIFTVLNRIKVNSILICVGGFAVVLVELFLLAFTDWGLYAIGVTSLAERLIRNLVYTVPAGARYLNRPWWMFFPEVGKSILCVSLVLVSGLLIKSFIPPISWSTLIASGVLSVLVGGGMCLLILFDKNDRKKLLDTFVKRSRR